MPIIYLDMNYHNQDQDNCIRLTNGQKSRLAKQQYALLRKFLRVLLDKKIIGFDFEEKKYIIPENFDDFLDKLGEIDF